MLLPLPQVLSISSLPSIDPRLRSFVLPFLKGVVSDLGSLGEGKGWAAATLTSDHPPKVGTPRARENEGSQNKCLQSSRGLTDTSPSHAGFLLLVPVLSHCLYY